MADGQLVTNNQEPSARNFSGLGDSEQIQDMDIEGGRGATGSTRGKTVDVSLSVTREVKKTTNSTPSRTAAPAVGSSTSTATPRPTTSSSTPPPQPAAAEPTPSEQKDFNSDIAPEALSPTDQQAVAGDLGSNRQKKLSPEQENQKQRAKSQQLNDRVNAPDHTPANKRDDFSSAPTDGDDLALKDMGETGDLGKGDIGNVAGAAPGEAGAPPELPPEDQQQAAAKQSADRAQAQQMQASANAEEVDQSGAEKFKAELLSGKYMEIAKHIPFLGRYIRSLDKKSGTGLKDLKSKIRTLTFLKFAALAAQRAAALTDLGKYLLALCGTGLGIIVAILLLFPGLFVALFYPTMISKLARTIDDMVNQINAILINLKKIYTTMQQQQQAGKRRSQQMDVSTRQQPLQPPPRPS